MKSTLLLGAFAAASQAFDLDTSPPHPDYIFSNPSVQTSDRRIPTAYESAVLGRRILALTKLGHLATVFPASSSSSILDHDEEAESEAEAAPQDWRRPAGLDGVPIGMMDYVADCEPNGNPTILAINIATTFQNIRAGSNLSVSMRWTPPFPPSNRMSVHGGGDAAPSPRGWLDAARDYLFSRPPPPAGDRAAPPRDTVPYSAANLPRFSLIGYLEKIDASDPVTAARLATCFVRTHPDAKYWLPGNRVHTSEWARLVVTSVYWVGGFGDRAYIGWLPVDQWHNITREEWEAVELPGERKGWREWSVQEEWAWGADL